MRWTKQATWVLAVMVVVGCGGSTATGPTGGAISVRFEVDDADPAQPGLLSATLTLTNEGDSTLGPEGWAMYFNSGGRVLAESLPPGVVVNHVNGDLQRLAPTADFAPLGAGESRTIAFQAGGSMANASAAPAGLYFVFDDGPDGATRAEAVGDYVVAPSASREKSPAARFEENSGLSELPADQVGPIVPTPVRVTQGAGRLALDGGTRIRHAPELAGEAAFLANALAPHLGAAPALEEAADAAPAAGGIVLTLGEVTVGGDGRAAGDEAYRLTIDDSSVEIVATDAAGAFYGVQSLLALLPVGEVAAGDLELGAVVVEDAPRFGYRGLHLDVSRNFHPPESVKGLLDVMALYKLNRFHFHLTDDEGWRLAIDGLPELVEVGARRGHSEDELDRLMPSFGSGPDPEVSHGSGHYTRDELVDLLRYAAARHIEVIPEIDVPGHARAAIKAMEARHRSLAAEGRTEEAEEYLLSEAEDTSEYRSVQGWDDNVINVCQESTYRFLEHVVDDLMAIFAEAEAPLTTIHIGGDEVPHGVWERSPACERLIQESGELAGAEDLYGYFVRRMNDLLLERDLVTAGWEEVALIEREEPDGSVKLPNEALAGRRVRAHVWNNIWGGGREEVGYQLANAGFEVVLSNASNLYFDLAYEPDWWEPGYAWAGFVDTRKPFELVPLDIYRSAREDLYGNPIERGIFSDRQALTAEGRRQVLGIQGQLWSENAKGQALLEFLALPKTLALAERAWAESPPWAEGEDSVESDRAMEASWNEFANRLGQRELARLDRVRGGFAYRLPPPGAVIEDGTLKANVAFPGLVIRYTTDGSDPGSDATLYTGPVEGVDAARLRVFDSRGRGSRIVDVAASP